jgi:hypothetical protein
LGPRGFWIIRHLPVLTLLPQSPLDALTGPALLAVHVPSVGPTFILLCSLVPFQGALTPGIHPVIPPPFWSLEEPGKPPVT